MVKPLWFDGGSTAVRRFIVNKAGVAAPDSRSQPFYYRNGISDDEVSLLLLARIPGTPTDARQFGSSHGADYRQYAATLHRHSWSIEPPAPSHRQSHHVIINGDTMSSGYHGRLYRLSMRWLRNDGVVFWVCHGAWSLGGLSLIFSAAGSPGVSLPGRRVVSAVGTTAGHFADTVTVATFIGLLGTHGHRANRWGHHRLAGQDRTGRRWCRSRRVPGQSPGDA